MKKVKKILSAVTAVALSATVICSFSVTSMAAETSTDSPTVSVVNFSPVWGDKETNISEMTKLIEEADKENTDIILFPEMAVTGYSKGMEYLNGSETPMPVELAESKTGQTAAYFSDLAEKYDMYIVYGATETIQDDSQHAYNSAFICTPEGMVDSYQKITPVEGDWCVAGDTPTYFSTPWGNVGISICYDTYATPELGRLYSAAGCFMMLNPTAVVDGDWGWDYLDYSDAVYCDYTSEYYIDDTWEDYYRLYLETAVQLDGLYVASSNILGDDGPENVRHFSGGSLIVGPSNTVQNAPTNDKYDYLTYYAGATSNDTYGIATATIDPSLATNSLTHYSSGIFQPNLYADWFSDLAAAYSSGIPLVAPPTTTDNPVCAVVNMNPVWGDKAANCSSIISYMEDAATQGVNIIVFPEMALTDYASTSDSTSEKWDMVCKEAEATNGIYATQIANKAKELGMYVIYGTSEPNPDDYNHPYNSAFVSTPDGDTLSYKKIQPVEGSWCTFGSEPLIVETPWGGMGISICMDTYSYPELTRYYSAAGCKMIINPTASGGYARKNFVYNTTLASTASRDGVVVLSSDLVGPGGSPDDSTVFPGKSTIIGTNGLSPIFYTEESMTDETMYVATPKMMYTGFAVTGYNPQVFADNYAKLANGEDLYDYSGLVAASEYVVPSTEATTVPVTTAEVTEAPSTATPATSATSATPKNNSTADTATTVDNSTIATGDTITLWAIVLILLGSAMGYTVYRKVKIKK